MPPLELHEDLFGSDGARLVVVEADGCLTALAFSRDWAATLLAFRIARELAAPDPFTPFALEGLALELTVAAARGPTPLPAAPWLERARELLAGRFLYPPSARDLPQRSASIPRISPEPSAPSTATASAATPAGCASTGPRAGSRKASRR